MFNLDTASDLWYNESIGAMGHLAAVESPNKGVKMKSTTTTFPIGMMQTDKSNDVVVVSGPHGTKKVKISQPQEIGLAVLDVMLGEAPAKIYRNTTQATTQGV